MFTQRTKGASAFTLIELMVVIAILCLLGTLVMGNVRKAFRSASLAISANNLRHLATGTMLYLSDHEMTFWKYRENLSGEGIRWWFGFEPNDSLRAGEGKRWFDQDNGPLGGYISTGMVPDPSLSQTGKTFKPKYQFGYIGAGYNVLLADDTGVGKPGWSGTGTPLRYNKLLHPQEVVVFATAAQVNVFQRPASPSNPMVEEFYGIDDHQKTVHFRHNGQAMVAYANGATGFMDMEPGSMDRRAPDAMIGRLNPMGDSPYAR